MSKQFDEVVNDDGELGVFVPYTAGATIRTQAEQERAKYYATTQRRSRFHHGRKYFVSYNDAVGEIIKDLSLTEAGALIKLLLVLQLHGGGRLEAKGKPLSKAAIARLLERSRPATNDIIDRLTEVGVMDCVEGRYIINERYHTVGSINTSALFTKVYTVRAREIIAGLRLNEIGLLYKIIPFFHYSEYYLCVNANSLAENIEYMGREGLATATGHAPETVSRLIAKLQSAGAMLVTGSRNEARYLVHPDLMFRQAEGTETEWTWAVRKLFDDHAKKGRP